MGIDFLILLIGPILYRFHYWFLIILSWAGCSNSLSLFMRDYLSSIHFYVGFLSERINLLILPAWCWCYCDKSNQYRYQYQKCLTYCPICRIGYRRVHKFMHWSETPKFSRKGTLLLHSSVVIHLYTTCQIILQHKLPISIYCKRLVKLEAHPSHDIHTGLAVCSCYRPIHTVQI